MWLAFPDTGVHVTANPRDIPKKCLNMANALTRTETGIQSFERYRHCLRGLYGLDDGRKLQ